MLEEFKDKKIAILGFGREGQDTLLFLRKLFPKKVIGIADKQKSSKLKSQILKPQPKSQNLKNIKWHLGQNYLKALQEYDAIIKSPGIPYKILPKASLKKITTQTEIFFNNCPGIIVGITGTKGKSTTTSLIYEILKSGGLRANLVGNIGKPVLNLLAKAKPDEVYVYELSSHQLFSLKKSPHIAVLLNIYLEHLDYYKNFKEYARAKANITLYQTKKDYFIYNSEDKLVSQIAKKSKAKKLAITGEYYDLDKAAARKVGEIFKVPKAKIEKAIKNFKFLPHRLELVGTFKGITFYDDAIATIPEATIAAIDKLGDRVETIFLGGFDRGIDYKNFGQRVAESKIKNAILFPTTGKKIWEEIEKAKRRQGGQKRQGRQRIQGFFVDNMRDAVRLAYKHTKNGKIALLSCASSSFSIFRDYEEKGDLFKKFVKLYGK